MNVEAVRELIGLALSKRLVMVTGETPPRTAFIEGDPDPDVLTAELLQLALFGAIVREMAEHSPGALAGDVVARADRDVVRPR